MILVQVREHQGIQLLPAGMLQPRARCFPGVVQSVESAAVEHECIIRGHGAYAFSLTDIQRRKDCLGAAVAPGRQRNHRSQRQNAERGRDQQAKAAARAAAPGNQAEGIAQRQPDLHLGCLHGEQVVGDSADQAGQQDQIPCQKLRRHGYQFPERQKQQRCKAAQIPSAEAEGDRPQTEQVGKRRVDGKASEMDHRKRRRHDQHGERGPDHRQRRPQPALPVSPAGLHQSPGHRFRQQNHPCHGRKGKLQTDAGTAEGIHEQNRRQRKSQRGRAVILPSEDRGHQQQRLHDAGAYRGRGRPRHKHKKADQQNARHRRKRPCPEQHLNHADQKGNVHSRHRHHMHEARSAHPRVQRRILIEIGLVAQHQRTHEDRRIRRKKAACKIREFFCTARCQRTDAVLIRKTVFDARQGPCQVDVLRHQAVAAFAVAQIGPAQLCIYRKHVSGNQVSGLCLIVIEHHVQPGFFRSSYVDPRGVIEPHRRLHHLYVQDLLGAVPCFGIAQRPVPMQSIGSKADGRAEQAEAYSPCRQASLPEKRRNRGRGKAGCCRWQNALPRQQVIGQEDCKRQRGRRCGELPHQMIFSPSVRPPIRWKCRCITVWPAAAPQLLMMR